MILLVVFLGFVQNSSTVGVRLQDAFFLIKKKIQLKQNDDY